MSALAKIAAWVLVGRAWLNRRRGTGDVSSHSVNRATPGQRAGPASTAEREHAVRGLDDRGEVPPQKSWGPGPDSPLDLERGDWRATLKRTLAEIKEDRITLAAAGMAYYFFLAIFPAFIALVGILGLFDVSPDQLAKSIENTLPGRAGQVLAEPITAAERSSDGASVVAAVSGIAVALWSASSGMVALQSGLNVAYDVPRDRKFVGKRGVAVALIVATGLLGGVPSPIFTFGESTPFQALGWILTIAAVVLLFSIYYYIAPNRESPEWQWVSVGGVVGAVLWMASSVAFKIYVEGFSSYGKTYGSQVGVIVLILWLYISSLAVLVGGELNAEIERQSERRRRAAA
jgi:membrane protein